MLTSIKDRFIKLLPAQLYHVLKRKSFSKVFKMLLDITWSYISVFLYLLRKRGIKAAMNFLSVKLFTPVGPGGAGVFWFAFGWFIRLFPLLIKFPRQLEFEISTRCTKLCIHCEHTFWERETQVRKRLEYDQIVNVLEQFPRLRWASLVGEGSSFEHPEMINLIKYLRSRHIMNYMPEHMADWDDKMIETVVSEDMDGIIVSLDAATKKTYEEIKVGCDFDNVIKNLKKLIAEKKRQKSILPELTFNFVAMKTNVHEIPEYVDLIAGIGSRKELGAGSRISVVRMLGFRQILDLQLDEVPSALIEDAQCRAEKHGHYINFTGTNVREELPPPNQCIAWMEPYIFMPGNISQCCAVFISNNRPFIKKHAHGNVLEQNFKDIWNNKSYKTLRYLINKSEAPIPIQCANCRIFNTLPREKEYGIIDTHTSEIYSLKDFYDTLLGDNMKWRYDGVSVDQFNSVKPCKYITKVKQF